jgi:hypothetical protein
VRQEWQGREVWATFERPPPKTCSQLTVQQARSLKSAWSLRRKALSNEAEAQTPTSTPLHWMEQLGFASNAKSSSTCREGAGSLALHTLRVSTPGPFRVDSVARTVQATVHLRLRFFLFLLERAVQRELLGRPVPVPRDCVTSHATDTILQKPQRKNNNNLIRTVSHVRFRGIKGRSGVDQHSPIEVRQAQASTT